MRRAPWPRIVAAVVALTGVVLVVVGALLATVWKPPTTSSVRVVADQGVPAVVTAPGALGLDGPSVRVEAFAARAAQPVFLGVARTADLDAWLAETPRQVLVGIDAADRAVTEKAGGSGTPGDPAASDIWVASVAGEGSAGLTWPEQDGSWSLVALADGTAAPQVVTFTWPLDPPTSLAPGVVALGVLLLVAGVVALAMLVVRDREEAQP